MIDDMISFCRIRLLLAISRLESESQKYMMVTNSIFLRKQNCTEARREKSISSAMYYKYIMNAIACSNPLPSLLGCTKCTTNSDVNCNKGLLVCIRSTNVVDVCKVL